MTQIARAAIMLEIPVDLVHLFRDKDPYYRTWLMSVIGEVSKAREEQERRAKAQMKTK